MFRLLKSSSGKAPASFVIRIQPAIFDPVAGLNVDRHSHGSYAKKARERGRNWARGALVYRKKFQ